MAMKKVVWLEVHGEKVVQLEDSVTPKDFEVVRPVSRTDKEEHLRLLADADYAIIGGIPMTGEYIKASKNLKLIQKWGIGADNIDSETARENGVAVSIAAGSNADAVAELAVGLMMATLRRIPYVDASTRRGQWLKASIRPTSFMIKGRTVGMLGMGNIAQAAVKKLSGFEANIIYFDARRLPAEKEAALNLRYVSFEELLKTSDILSLHIPLLPSTEKIIGEKQFAMMKPGSVLINTARGKLVDEKALCRALTEGPLQSAGMDAYEEEPPSADCPLLKMDNVVLSNHCGNSTIDSVIPVTQHVFNNIVRFENGEPIPEIDVIVPRVL